MKKSMKNEIKSGFCSKEGGIIHSIKKRFWILYPDCLKYYTDINGEEKGSIPLTPDTIVANDPKYKIQPCFTIYIPSKKRTYYILPETEIDRDEWIGTISNLICLKKANNKSTLFQRLSYIYENYITLSEMLWNAKKESIPTIIKYIRHGTQKNVFALRQILGMFDYITQRRLRNLDVLEEIVHEYIHSQKIPDLQSHFKECQHLVALLIKRCAMTSKMPEQFMGKSEKDILEIYQQGTLNYALFYDNVEELKKFVDAPDFSPDKLYDGLSILSIAARFGSFNCFKYIFDKGVPINVSVFEEAYYGGNVQIIELLKSAKFEPPTCIDFAVMNHQTELVEYLMQTKGLDYTYKACLNSYNFKAFFDKLFRASTIDDKDSELQTPLIAASASGFYSIVKILVENNAEIDLTGPSGNTPFIYAIINNQSEAAGYLASQNASVEAKNLDNATPIIIATQNNHLGMVRLLVDSKADINATDKFGNTALMYSLKNVNEKIASYLLDYRANTNVVNEEGNTALFFAIETGNEELVRMLLDKNADPTIKNLKGETSLMWAARQPNINVALLILQCRVNTEEKDSDYMTALIHACHNNNHQLAKILISRGSSVDAFDKNGLTPLMYSCSKNYVDTVKALLEAGANTEITDFEGKTALIHAVLGNSANSIKLLLQRNANKEVRDQLGRTPVIIAIVNNCFDAAMSLAWCGADLSARDRYNVSVLYHAVEHNCKDIVEFIVKHCRATNFDIFVDNKTPLMVAAQNRYFEIIEMLIKAEASQDVMDQKGYTPLCYAATMNEVDVVKAFVKAGGNVNTRDSRQNTPLMHAAASGFIETAKVLLDAGAAVNTMNMTKYTALVFAVKQEHPEMVRLLCQKSANIDHEDDKGMTPLMLAALADNKEICEILLEFHAEKRHMTSDGKSAYDLAVESGAKNVLGILE